MLAKRSGSGSGSGQQKPTGARDPCLNTLCGCDEDAVLGSAGAKPHTGAADSATLIGRKEKEKNSRCDGQLCNNHMPLALELASLSLITKF